MLYSLSKRDYNITAFLGGYDKNITYLVGNNRLDKVWSVDASVPLNNLPIKLQNKITDILITHTHGDHIAYLDQYVKRNPKVKIYLFKGSSYKKHSEKTTTIMDGDIFPLDHVKIEVLHTPGHYPDSCCFLVNASLFTGDTVFIGRTGRTISIGSNVRTLYKSVYSKLLTLQGDITIFPGHDYGPEPYCSIKKNIKISPLLQAQNEDDFVQRMEKYERSRLS